jgi:hypothetical protein
MFSSPNYFLTGKSARPSLTQKGIFGFGAQPGFSNNFYSMTNIVTSAGVVGTDNSTVATAKDSVGATTYGGDKGIFGFGWITNSTTQTNNRNLVSNTGVLTTDAATSGTARSYIAACGFSKDRGIFGFGFYFTAYLSTTNLVSNTGVVGSDVAGVVSGRYSPAACRFGGTRGIFAFGQNSGGAVGVSNLISAVEQAFKSSNRDCFLFSSISLLLPSVTLNRIKVAQEPSLAFLYLVAIKIT